MANRSEIPAADETASLRARVAELEQRLADYEQFAGRLGEIAQAVTAATGGEFFRALVEGVAKSLNIEHAMVGELVEPPGQRIKILAMYSQGAHAAEVEYDLDGTPCENVMAGHLCIYPRDIQRLFPRDRVLVEMGAECYVGTPLYDSKGQPIGLVVLIGTTPLVDAPRAEATLRIFAARAAAELERLRAEDARHESEQRFKAFMDNNPSVAFMKDLSGRYIYVNKPFCTRFNRALDSVFGRTDYDLFPAAVAAKLRENDAAILASGRTRQIAEAVPTPDGVLRHWLVYKFPIEDAAGRVLLGGVAIDVTDLKQAEEALRDSEETVRRQFGELESIYNSAPVGLAMMDLDLRYVRVNAQLARGNGVSAAEHAGKRLRDVIPQLAPQIEPLYRRVIATGLPIVNFEIHGPAPDDPNVERDWLATYSPLKRLDGSVLGVSTVVQDVTEIKQAQEEIRKARDELELQVAERTASLVQANTNLQHEILERQAAAKALRAEQLLLRQLLDSQEADRKLIAYEVHDGLVQYVTGAVMHLESVAVTGGRKPGDLGEDFSLALRLLRDTIQEARRMISGLRPLILDESGVVQAIEYLQGECKDGPRVDFEHDVAFDRLSPLVEGAIFRICQQALNNATKHSKSKVIRIQLVQRGDWVRLVVSDQGVGFDPAKITEKMFGLQGIRERTRLLGGQAAIVTAPGRGTQVTIDIPLSPSG